MTRVQKVEVEVDSTAIKEALQVSQQENMKLQQQLQVLEQAQQQKAKLQEELQCLHGVTQDNTKLQEQLQVLATQKQQLHEQYEKTNTQVGHLQSPSNSAIYHTSLV